MKYSFIIIAGLLAFSACDSGDIYPKEEEYSGRNVNVTLHFFGVNAWPEEYELKLTSFGDNEDTPLTTLLLEKNDEGSGTYLMHNVPFEAKNIAVSIMNNRKWVCNLNEQQLSGSETNISLSDMNVNLVQYNRIQEQVFNQCTACHGGAGGLYLTEDKSYDALVNKASSTHPDKMLVEPGLPNSSFIITVLIDAQATKTNHTTLSSLKNDDITLLKEWIKAGAKKQ